MSLIVLVCGGRDFGERDRNDAIRGAAYLSEMHKATPIDLIVEGGAPGADALARVWCDFARVPCRTMRADWSRYGKAAGPRRNAEMLAVLVAERDKGADVCVVAFPGGRGTADCVRQSRALGVRVVEVHDG